MKFSLATAAFVTLLLIGNAVTLAEEEGPPVGAIKAAIIKAIPLLEAGSRGSAEERKCFTCHSQAMPIFALTSARRKGFEVESENLERQLKHTYDHLERGTKNYLAGKGQGGRVLTAGYALWALEAGEQTADETTAAVTDFLLKYQSDRSHWRHPGSRPPTSGSDFTATYVALRGLDAYGSAEQQEQIDKRKQQVREWLLDASPKETEDHVFRVWALSYLAPGDDAVSSATSDLLKLQHENGGWAQLPEMKPDAYATATALAVLLETGEASADDPAIGRGLKYLLDTQHEDGSWHVVTRAKGFQTYFESGFPHGKDQFVSIAASSWATYAMTLTLPDAQETTKPQE